jgi:hypothetical protein
MTTFTDHSKINFMKRYVLQVIGLMFFGTSVFGQLTEGFKFETEVYIPADSADLTENAAKWNRPSHIEEGRSLVYLFNPRRGIFSVNKSSGQVDFVPLDKEFKLAILGKFYPNPEEMYNQPLPAGASEEMGKGGLPTGFATFGDTLYFTYNFTYSKKMGASSIPSINVFLVGFYDGEVISMQEIDHGFVMSIDMPVYFINPSTSNFFMESPTEAIFTVTSMMENRPFLFANMALKNNKWEIKKVLTPKLSSELVNEEKGLTILAASQTYIRPPFLGCHFSNEVWTYEKKSKVFRVPTDGEPEMGITMRLGEPVPPSFAVIDLLPENDQIAHILLYENKQLFLQKVEIRKAKELLKTPLLPNPITTIDEMPVVSLLQNNRLAYFDGAQSVLKFYSY